MGVNIQWLAHAAFKIKTIEKIIYIDPRCMKKFKSKIGEFFEKPDKANLILFTHHHADHCYPSSFSKMITSNTIFIGPEKCSEKIGNIIKIVAAGNVLNIDNVRIKVVEAYNIKRHRNSGNLWHPKGLGVGFLICIDRTVIYHAGDTECIPEMKAFGPIDLALLPLDGKFTMNIEEAIDAAKLIKPKIVIPMHEHETDLLEFKKKMEAETDIKVVVLEYGENYKLI